MEFTKKLRDLNGITIPIEIVQAYDINKGDLVTLEVIKITKK